MGQILKSDSLDGNCINLDFPFKLHRKLLMIVLLACLTTLIVLLFLFRTDHLRRYEYHATHQAEAHLNSISYRLSPAIDELFHALGHPQDEAIARQRLDDELQLLYNEADFQGIQKIKIYDLTGRTIYSSAANEIGHTTSRPDLLSLALLGKSAHALDLRDEFQSRLGQLHRLHVFATYFPLRKNNVQFGVIESYLNADPEILEVNRESNRLSLVIISSFVLLYLSLYYFIRNADKKLTAWKDQIKVLLSASRDGILQISNAGKGELLNQQFLEIWQIPTDLGSCHDYQTIQRHIADLTIEPARYVQRLSELHSHPEAISHEFVSLKDGRVIEQRSYPTQANVSKAGRIWSFRDVTHLKQSERELRLAAAAFQTQDAIIITDISGKIIRVNEAFTRITGYSNEEVIGKNPRAFSSGKHDKRFYAEMWDSVINQGKWAGEIWDRRKSGELFPKWLSITAVRNEDGAVENYVGIFSDITERKRHEEELKNLAFQDPLTGLPNRRFFMERFASTLAYSAKNDNYGALLFIDLDHFKALNDTHGHDYGDLLLKTVSQRIRSCIRDVDTVARLGGDEFVVLLDSVDRNQMPAKAKAGQVAEKIRAAVAMPYRLHDVELHFTLSIGVCIFHGGEEPESQILLHADQAMYQAKQSGRNLVCFFDSAGNILA